MTKNDFKNNSGKRGARAHGRAVLQALAGLACSLAAVSAIAQAQTTLTGLTVTIPNGYANITVDDMRVVGTAGPARWSRSWNGKEWKFNAHWESLSQSWTNLTGSMTGTSTGSTALSAPPPSDAESGCWVMVDEDWKPSTGTTLIDGKPAGAPMLPERTAPFNRVMGEDQNDYPPPRMMSVDYASLCKGTATLSSPVRDVEAVRLKNELYLGDNGRYAFSNRTVLEKRAVRALPAVAAATLDAQLAAGTIGLAPVSVAKGFRWMDKGGDWIDYNTQGQVVAYGDRNDNTVWLARDTGGRLRGVVDANGRVMFTLHYRGELITEVRDYPIAGMSLDLPARSVKYEYDAANRLTAVVDVRGNTTRYGYDASNHIVTITDQEGRVESLAYAGSSVAKRTAPDGGVTDYLFEYDDTNKQFTSRITGPATAAGRRIEEFTHNRSGQLVRRTVNGRVDDEVRYDAGMRAEIRTNARGFSSRLTRNEFDQVVELVREDGSTVKSAYSALTLQLSEATGETGVKTQYQYDARGNLAKMVEAAGTPDERVSEYEANSLGQTIKVTKKGRTEPNGTVTADAITVFAYDALGHVRSVTDPEGNVTQFAFDRTGNLVRTINPRGYASTFEMNADGLLVKTTDALGRVLSYAHDKVGNLISLTDAGKKETRLVYDAMNRLSRNIGPSDAVATLQYSGQGQATVITDPDGRKVELEYDNFLRLSKQTDGLGNVTNFSYQIPDGSGNGVLGSLSSPTEINYPTYTAKTRFDQLERPVIATLVEPAHPDRISTISYDARGLAKSATNANGKTRSFNYDDPGQPRVVTDSLGKQTKFLHDARGNLIQVTDANGNAHRYEYDRNNRVIKEVLPLGQTFTTKYDASGNVISRVDPNGGSQSFTYDAANRLIETTQSDAGRNVERTVRYSWNASNQLVGWTDNAKGSETSAVVGYDEGGRKTQETVTYPGGFSMGYAYGYSKASKKTQLRWPDGTLISYGYSAHGELESVTIPGEGTISVNQFNWRAPGRITLPGGSIKQKSYDGLSNLTALAVKGPTQRSLLNLTKTYGKVQEVTQSTRSDLGGATTIRSYGYDDEIRLTRVVTDSGGFGTDTETFALDGVANRIAHSKQVGAWVYDEDNRLKQRGEGNSAVQYDYDDAGNTIQKREPGSKATKYLYNSANQLIEVRNESDQIVARYGYDPMGRRTWKEQYRDRAGLALSQATRTLYLYADEGLVAEATQPIMLGTDNSVTTNAVALIVKQYGPRPAATFTTGVLLIKTKNSNGGDTIAYYHHDHVGTPLQATDRSGNVVWAANYDPFGRAQIVTPAATAESPTISSDLRLPGQIEDAETGLHYNHFRHYDPQTGRYIERDPIGLHGGVNTYAYVGGNPIDQIDPDGLRCVAQGQRVSCTYPGQPAISFPRPAGWPTVIDSSSRWYHKYNKQVDSGCLTAGDLMPGLISNPTPGYPNPATPQGTPNDATPPIIGNLVSALDHMGGGSPGPAFNPVLSYLSKDASGRQIVINVTQPGHNLFPGYVVRTVNGSVIHNYGEGNGAFQSDYAPDWMQDLINNGWYELSQDVIDKTGKKCLCK